MKKSLLFVFGLVLILGFCGFENCACSSSHKNDSCDNDSADAEYVSDEDESIGRMYTGDGIYLQCKLPGNDSFIKVIAPDSCDVIAIVKWDGDMVRNIYICASDSDVIGVPNDTYQMFFYEGNGWKWSKEMPCGHHGGFVENERFMKANPVTVKDQVFKYDLKSLKNDKYQIVTCRDEECF